MSVSCLCTSGTASAFSSARVKRLTKSAGVAGALAHVRQHCQGQVLIVSSGGPIATAIGQVLGTPPDTTIELNLRYRNTAVSELTFTPRRHMLVTYNTLPHLDAAPYRDWVTYA